MEKKTMGSFIAALRKVSGMTQRELAERVGVSDKAVSRWERDECAPDLSLIPVLADIFGVTADELLRGERKNSENTDEMQSKSAKSEKEIRNIIKKTQTSYLTGSLICIMLVIVGFLAAMLCNFGFNRALIGFCFGAAFALAAIVTQVIVLIRAFGQFTMDEISYSELVLKERNRLIVRAIVFVSAIAVCASTLIPLITLAWDGYSIDGYVGVIALAWLTYGALAAAISAVLCVLIGTIVICILKSKGVYFLTEHDRDVFLKLRSLALRTTVICGALMAVVIATTSIITYIARTDLIFVKGNTFDTPETLKNFLETPPQGYDPEAFEYIDQDVFLDVHGEELFNYYPYNLDIARFKYSGGDGFPVTVYTYDDINANAVTVGLIYFVAVLLCIADAASGIVIGVKKGCLIRKEMEIKE